MTGSISVKTHFSPRGFVVFLAKMTEHSMFFSSQEADFQKALADLGEGFGNMFVDSVGSIDVEKVASEFNELARRFKIVGQKELETGVTTMVGNFREALSKLPEEEWLETDVIEKAAEGIEGRLREVIKGKEKIGKNLV